MDNYVYSEYFRGGEKIAKTSKTKSCGVKKIIKR